MAEYTNLFVTLMGIGTVFFGLVCIILLIMAMSMFARLQKQTTPVAAPAPAAAAPVAAAPVVNTAKQQEIIAAITAAISEELGSHANSMTILDIQKL